MAERRNQGRRRLNMEPMQNEGHRQVTFSKRRSGIFKKASELCTLTAAEMAMIVFSPGGKPFSFGHPSVDEVIDRYLVGNPPEDHHTMQLVAAHRTEAIQRLNSNLTQERDMLEEARRRASELKEIEKTRESQHWYERPIEDLNERELLELKQGLSRLAEELARRGSMTEASHQQQQQQHQHLFRGASPSQGPIYGSIGHHHAGLNLSLSPFHGSGTHDHGGPSLSLNPLYSTYHPGASSSSHGPLYFSGGHHIGGPSSSQSPFLGDGGHYHGGGSSNVGPFYGSVGRHPGEASLGQVPLSGTITNPDPLYGSHHEQQFFGASSSQGPSHDVGSHHYVGPSLSLNIPYGNSSRSHHPSGEISSQDLFQGRGSHHPGGASSSQIPFYGSSIRHPGGAGSSQGPFYGSTSHQGFGGLCQSPFSGSTSHHPPSAALRQDLFYVSTSHQAGGASSSEGPSTEPSNDPNLMHPSFLNNPRK